MRRILRGSIFAAAIAAISFCAQAQISAGPPPMTAKHPVTDEYFGVKVTDDYRWLENYDDPAVKQWIAQQNAYTHDYLSKLPQRAALLAKIKANVSARQTQYWGFIYRGGKLFALRADPGNSGLKVVVFDSPENKASERTIMDLAVFTGGLTQPSWYQPSQDGKLLGIALGSGGSEDCSLYVVDVATGKQVGATVPRVQFATGGGSMAWKWDSSGFYYTRYPQGSERAAADADFYQQIYFHKMGTEPSADTYVVGKDFPRIAEAVMQSSPDGKEILIAVENGDGGEYAQYVIGMNGFVHQISKYEDKIVEAHFAPNDDLWMLSRKSDDNGQILWLHSGVVYLGRAKAVVTEDKSASIEGFVPMANRLYVMTISGGPEQLEMYDTNGKRLGDVPAPAVASIGGTVPLSGDKIMYMVSTYTTPPAWFAYSGTGEPTALPFKKVSNVNYDDVEVKRVMATSKDGTQVPMSIVMRKGTKLDGTNPAIITGYGGFGIRTSPYFAGEGMRTWFDQGGIFVETNIRGGAEFGEAWHRAGMLTNKQNVFDDFSACTEYLIKNGYTSPAHLAAQGGSNGGLLMGAMITQHPGDYRVVLTFVGIYDMLRTELDPNGSFNTTEYGTVKNAEQFKALYAYSPYQHVVAGTKYPAVLFVTGDNDHRVNPAHSRKMTAELQAATASGYPVMLRTQANAGHGMIANEDDALNESADVLAFLYAQLGMEVK
jgi:prolyl oligopeptidase